MVKLMAGVGLCLAIVMGSTGAAQAQSVVGRWKPLEKEPGKLLEFYVFKSDGTGTSHALNEGQSVEQDRFPTPITWKQNGNRVEIGSATISSCTRTAAACATPRRSPASCTILLGIEPAPPESQGRQSCPVILGSLPR